MIQIQTSDNIKLAIIVTALAIGISIAIVTAVPLKIKNAVFQVENSGCDSRLVHSTKSLFRFIRDAQFIPEATRAAKPSSSVKEMSDSFPFANFSMSINTTLLDSIERTATSPSMVSSPAFFRWD